MSSRHIIAFDAGGTAVKAAIYDERGEELAVAGAVMAPLHPAPGCLERDPASDVVGDLRSLAQGLGGVGGRAVVDRRRRPDRLRQRALSSRSRRQAGPQRHPFARPARRGDRRPLARLGARGRGHSADLPAAVAGQAGAADRLARGARARGARARRARDVLQGLSALSPDRRFRPRNQRPLVRRA